MRNLGRIASTISAPVVTSRDIFSPGRTFRIVGAQDTSLVGVGLVGSNNVCRTRVVGRLTRIYKVRYVINDVVRAGVNVATTTRFTTDGGGVAHFSFSTPLVVTGRVIRNKVRCSNHGVALPSRRNLNVEGMSLVIGGRRLAS